jgi:putative nucleotidyltransferase with HDIG domain
MRPVNGSARSLATGSWRLAAGLLCVALLGAVFLSTHLPEGATLEVGSVAPQDYLAPRGAIDVYRTNEARQRAANAQPDQYRFDPGLGEAALIRLDRLSSDLRSVFSDQTLDRDARIAAILGKLPPDASPLVARQLEDLGLQGWSNAYAVLRAGVSQVMGSELSGDEARQARTAVAAGIRGLRLQAALADFLVGLVNQSIVPTMVLDVEETSRRRAAAMAEVESVMILRDQIIARRGEVLTTHQLTLLQDLGMLRARLDPQVIVGSLLLALVFVALAGAYLRLYEGSIFKDASRLFLLVLLATLVLLAAQLTRGISPYLAPVAAGTMLVASLLSPRLALFVGFMSSVAIGLITGGEMRFLMVALTGGLAGVYSLSWVGQRSDLTRAGLVVGLANVAVAMAFALLGGQPLVALETWRDFGFAFANGIISAILTIGTMPFFESTFGILTAVRLLELANPNQPLLRRLLVEAPGTYHHSVVVGNLAEAAADVVGGNPLLARVGAYYHDIGKVIRPYFFIENQIGQDNPHDKISPSLSTLIVTSHVKDGMALAKEAKLPDKVAGFIRSHHGRSLVSYFYSRAASDGGVERLVEEDFRYDGPLPETREEAIVMLADSSEAAVRAMTNPTPERIEALVKRLIRERLVDGQLERCDLTLRDLDRIGEIFVRVLLGIFHARIEYPQTQEELMRQIQASGLDAGQKKAGDGAGPAGGPGDAEPAAQAATDRPAAPRQPGGAQDEPADSHK